jgi:hypothetical protein
LEITVTNQNYSQEQWLKDLDSYRRKPVEKILTPKQKKAKAEIKKLESDLKEVQKTLDNPNGCDKDNLEKLILKHNFLAADITLKKIFLDNSMSLSESDKSFNVSRRSSITVPPLTKTEIKFTTRLTSNENLEFTINWLGEFIYGIGYQIKK